MTTPHSHFEELARLLAYYRRSADLVQTQIETLWGGEDPRTPTQGLGASLHGPTAADLRRRAEDRRRARPSGSSRTTIQRRVHTATVLAHFNPTEPRRSAPGMRGIAALVRRGYLKRQGVGYVRTAKPFHVDPRGV